MSVRPRGAVALILVACALAGCSSGQSVENERRQAAEVALEHAAERRAADLRAARIERTISFDLRPSHSPSCRLETAAAEPRDGIAPLACGDLAGHWPLTVAWGFLRCEPGADGHHRVVFSTPRGAAYAVDVAARAIGYADIGPILDPSLSPAQARRSLRLLAARC